VADEDCIFCAIASGDGPAEIIQEDEHTVAFMDINPWTRGHSLVIPRQHAKDIFEIEDNELAHVMTAVKRLATRIRDTLQCDGINLLNSAESAAWQTVFHFHVHVIPRYEDDPLQLPGKPMDVDQDELEQIADEIRG
jgi:histidine triad (HIT) family protein